MPKKPKLTPAQPLPPDLVTLETYQPVRGWTIRQFEQAEPSAFNGEVRVRRYRVTIELIPDGDAVLAARIQKLWDRCTNHHHYDPLRKAAADIRYVLVGAPGNKAQEQ